MGLAGNDVRLTSDSNSRSAKGQSCYKTCEDNIKKVSYRDSELRIVNGDSVCNIETLISFAT